MKPRVRRSPARRTIDILGSAGPARRALEAGGALDRNRPMRAPLSILVGLLFTHSSAHAHGAAAPDHLVTLDPFALAGLAAAALAYGYGLARLRRRRATRGLPPWRVMSFGLGLALLAAALIWPLDALGEWSFAAHMGQHLLLIVLAPPLLVLGAPLAPLAAFAPARRFLAYVPWRRLTHPLAASALHGAVVWAWHAPGLFEWALRFEAAHVLEHATMLGSALLFWWALVHAARGRASGFGGSLVCLFLTMLHMGLLGALLTFAPRPLYPVYGDRPEALGLAPLEDQQLAGLIMWVPGGLGYLLAALGLAAAWLRQAERGAGWAPPTT